MANFIHQAGTNGNLATPFVCTDSLSALPNGNTLLSATIGTSGKFSQTNTGSAQYGEVHLDTLTAGWTSSVGGNITGWFITSTDGGTTFEKTGTNLAPPRPPDFIIPVPITVGAGERYPGGIVPLPYHTFKVLVQNNTGATLGSGAHTVSIAPVADTFA